MELQRRREATGMSREEVARQLEWSTSTLFRIETGRSRPQPGNVRTLLELYGVTGAERDGLIQLTREARQPGWWHSFRDVLPNPYEVYIGLEAGATSIRNFEPIVVPGLLQTADYARETIRTIATGCRMPGTTRISHSWIRMAVASRSMTGAKYEGQTSRATRSRTVAEVAGVWKVVSQR